ncbi:hypothetical protein ACWOFR_01215 [Carnobacterium gallinarum]|uniref:hypothetical protein n=1 Tax=Carnobacterium gallinarum TaxID=2749 RepID=UPI0012F84A66|nr:hypothetical protein [Carnobacterium gallinarum]
MMKIFMGSRLIPEVSIWQILALVIYFSAIFIFLKLMNVIYIFTNNKITTVLMVYLLCYGDLFLQKLGIQLFFAHGFMKDAANASKQVFLKNSLFLLLLFTILEVAQRWMIFEKNYIKKAK